MYSLGMAPGTAQPLQILWEMSRVVAKVSCPFQELLWVQEGPAALGSPHKPGPGRSFLWSQAQDFSSCI